MDDQGIDELTVEVGRFLANCDGGVGEFTLISHLRDAGWVWFQRHRVDDQLALFRQHFLLFHVLYRLRDRLRAEGVADLSISALRIALEPYRPGEEGIDLADPLQEYYLDLSHLQETSREEVDDMLSGFWSRAGAMGEKGAALAVLGLEEPVDLPGIKRRYRQLAMRHHPDRGGDKAQLQELNRAMATLNRCYGKTAGGH